jgi:hypothetical protein
MVVFDRLVNTKFVSVLPTTDRPPLRFLVYVFCSKNVVFVFQFLLTVDQ